MTAIRSTCIKGTMPVNERRTPSETAPARMGALARLPVFLSLVGKRAVLAGGSPAAAWKAELMSAAGATVDVFAENPSEELVHLAHEPPLGAVAINARRWVPADLTCAAVAIGAFEDDEGAAAFASAARAAGVPVNVIDKPGFCDFSLGAIVNRSPLVIGISTDGAAPVFAQAIRAKLEAFLPIGFAGWAGAAARWRPAVKASGLPFAARSRFWQLFAGLAVNHPERAPAPTDLDALLATTRERAAVAATGTV